MRKDCLHEEQRHMFRAQQMPIMKRKEKNARIRNVEAAGQLSSINIHSTWKTCLGAVEYHAAQFMCNHIFVLFDYAIFWGIQDLT